MLTWTVSDRANRVAFFCALLVAVGAGAPALAGVVSFPLMVVALLFFAQAWRLALGRQVAVRIDETGITKRLGGRTWHLGWPQVRGASLTGFLGTSQLLLDSSEPATWSASDSLFWLAGRGRVAVQVPDALLADLRALLGSHALPLA